jgi:heptosyltransferase II
LKRLVILAPNWLGDAVMALPAIADVRRESPDAEIVVAARPSIAPLFRIVADVNEVIDVERLDRSCDTALLLPNSFRSALLAVRARIPERWGYRTQGRAALLTRAIHSSAGLHQAASYQYLVHALGFPNGEVEPRLAVPMAECQTGRQALGDAGCDLKTPVVALAPGAAYGGAKRWPPEYFAELAHELAADGVTCVMVGTAADAETAGEVTRAFQSMISDAHRRRAGTRGLRSLVGRTDLPTLAGVLASCRALVTNDSGAMHLAAAIGVAVTAVFGPTDDTATRPLGEAHRVLTHPVWCRPCLLRECPLEHRCMRGLAPAAVADEARRTL